ncbi:MAG: radical SAM family heme chaperone HemW [Pirellulaceae bacterium]
MTLPRFQTPKAAYVHVPFCRHKCGYCNFTVAANRDDLIESYLKAIRIELSWLQHPHEVTSLYVGGGTPSHLNPSQLRRFLATLLEWFPPDQGCEITLEANPADVDADRLGVLVEAGVNRVSLGVQSLQDRKLEWLQRDHRRHDIAKAWELLRPKIPVLNLDLIFAAPGETAAEWQTDLQLALASRPDHLSIYGLTIERGSSIYGQRRRGEWRAVEEDLQRALFESAIDTLTDAHFEHYEVSNFARDGCRCRHNEVYWTGRGYYAAGPGAARYVNGHRETNHRSVTTYLKRVLAGQSPVAERERLSPEDAAREHLVFSLRRLEGIDKQTFAQETGFTVAGLGGAELPPFVAQGHLQDSPTHLRLTRAGLMISDAIWPALLRDGEEKGEG